MLLYRDFYLLFFFFGTPIKRKENFSGTSTAQCSTRAIFGKQAQVISSQILLRGSHLENNGIGRNGERGGGAKSGNPL